MGEPHRRRRHLHSPSTVAFQSGRTLWSLSGILSPLSLSDVFVLFHGEHRLSFLLEFLCQGLGLGRGSESGGWGPRQGPRQLRSFACPVLPPPPLSEPRGLACLGIAKGHGVRRAKRLGSRPGSPPLLGSALNRRPSPNPPRPLPPSSSLKLLSTAVPLTVHGRQRNLCTTGYRLRLRQIPPPRSGTVVLFGNLADELRPGPRRHRVSSRQPAPPPFSATVPGARPPSLGVPHPR